MVLGKEVILFNGKWVGVDLVRLEGRKLVKR